MVNKDFILNIFRDVKININKNNLLLFCYENELVNLIKDALILGKS